jgi:hypothetical protein
VPDSKNPFVVACTTALSKLTEDFGFDEPKVERFGREVCVHYHKAHRTVSIACEPGLEPIIEFFYPASETGEPPLPWAARNGVARCRRIPQLGVKQPPRRGSPFDYATYLESAAQALFTLESRWLAA